MNHDLAIPSDMPLDGALPAKLADTTHAAKGRKKEVILLTAE